ncbi:MAG: ABC transporter permease [Myxococcota bacterium]
MDSIAKQAETGAIREIIFLLTRHRQLTWAMTRREISDRYAGQVVGVLWAFGHPLAMIAVYIFLFAVVFKARVGDHAGPGYVVYLLSGLLPWMAFQESMQKSGAVLVANSSLVKQVVFPIEILPVKSVLSSLMTQAVGSVVLVLWSPVALGSFHLTIFLLPLLWVTQITAMIGVAYLLSAVGTFLRDIKDFVQLFGLIGSYLVPIAYLPEWVPEAMRPLLYANPFSYMVWCYQDLVFNGTISHPYAFLVFPLLALTVFALGYRVFRRLKPYFGNVL